MDHDERAVSTSDEQREGAGDTDEPIEADGRKRAGWSVACGLLASGLASFSWAGVGSKSRALAGTALPVASAASVDGSRAISPVADREGFKIGGLSGGPDGAPAPGAAVARTALSPAGRHGVDRNGVNATAFLGAMTASEAVTRSRAWARPRAGVS